MFRLHNHDDEKSAKRRTHVFYHLPPHFVSFFLNGTKRYLAKHKPFALNVGDSNGDTPLHVSSCYGHHEVLRVLLESGADTTLVNAKGFTSLHMSSTRECTELLLEYKTDPFAIDRNGRTALFCSSATNRYDCAAVLCEHCVADDGLFPLIDLADNRGDTPMHAAVCNGHTEVLWLLLSSGADPNIANQRGWTPDDLAVAAKKHECRKILRGEYVAFCVVLLSLSLSLSLSHVSFYSLSPSLVSFCSLSLSLSLCLSSLRLSYYRFCFSFFFDPFQCG